ncbi:hypothetical protein BS78_10G273300 [Paspalum vaginatum]|nr:hypothetical protein BS78_10G273300 [Paspalum vaginatum]
MVHISFLRMYTLHQVQRVTHEVKGFKNWKKVKSGNNCAFKTHMGESGSAHQYSVKCFDSLKNRLCHIEPIIEKQTDEEVKANRLHLRTSIDAKQILDLIACNVQTAIRSEIGDAKFCMIVDESRDESRREQMALVVRFVDKGGFIRERFLDLMHVQDTSSATLKEELCSVLSNHKLDVKNIRGQGYDGANNMRGEWDGLQAKFVEECPYGYYIHCFAHQLQLALVAASKEVPEVHNFFEHLDLIVNTVVSSTKRNDDLHANQIAEMEHLIELNELETGKGTNQIRTLQRPGETRWNSHYNSICNLIKLYKPTFLVLKDIATAKGSGTTASVRAKAAGVIKLMMSFDFVFIMHVMKELMGVTDLLCKKLQHKSQDLVNAMDDVVTTKRLIQNLRDHEIIVPNMADFYADYIRSRAGDEITVEHHYRYDIFTVAVDQQAQELNYRFSEQATELLKLCTASDPKDAFSSLKIDDVCSLASKFYPADFSEQEICTLRLQLHHYEFDVPTNSKLIRLVLTLPVSTAITERAFSTMKLVKTRLRNKMEYEFLRDCLITYIEKEIAMGFTTDKLIDDFDAIRLTE